MNYVEGDRVISEKYGAGTVAKIKGKYIFVRLDKPIERKKRKEAVVKFLAHSLTPEKKKTRK